MTRRFALAAPALAALWLMASVTLSAQLAGRATRPQVIPPQGPVRQAIFKYCTNCHGIDDYAYSALDRAKWDALITAKRPGQGGIDGAQNVRRIDLPRIEPPVVVGVVQALGQGVEAHFRLGVDH